MLAIYWSMPREIRTKKFRSQIMITTDVNSMVFLTACFYMLHFILTRKVERIWQQFLAPLARPVMRELCKWFIMKRLESGGDSAVDLDSARRLLMYPDFFHSIFSVFLITNSNSSVMALSVTLSDLAMNVFNFTSVWRGTWSINIIVACARSPSCFYVSMLLSLHARQPRQLHVRKALAFTMSKCLKATRSRHHRSRQLRHHGAVNN